MLTAIKNNRSLSFYQQSSILHQSKISTSYAGGIGSVALSNISFQTAATTTSFNRQLNEFLAALNAERERLAEKVAQKLAEDPSYTGSRNAGVRLAWEYERADIEMGGKGSADWTEKQQTEIRETGKVRRAEGHHQKNVAAYPELQADPDNIKFYEDKKKHLEEGHDGDWKNESNKPCMDKNKMLQKTNQKRVFKNELRGLGIAIAVGTGLGLTIGFVTTLAQSGVTPDSLRLALAEGTKGGIESGILAGIGYGIGRTIGEVASKTVAGVLGNLGVAITDNISKMINMGVVGTLTIAVFSAYQFTKLKLNGIATKDALIHIGKQVLFSLSLLTVSIAAQGIWGGAAGIIVSVSVGIIIITYSVADLVHQRHFAEEVRVYTIEKCYPSFIV